MVIPALVLFIGMLIWGLMAAAAQIRCVDSARAGARAAARSEPISVAIASAKQAAPHGAEVHISRNGHVVDVEVEARSLAPGPLATLLSIRIHARAEALAEDTVSSAG